MTSSSADTQWRSLFMGTKESSPRTFAHAYVTSAGEVPQAYYSQLLRDVRRASDEDVVKAMGVVRVEWMVQDIAKMDQSNKHRGMAVQALDLMLQAFMRFIAYTDTIVKLEGPHNKGDFEQKELQRCMVLCDAVELSGNIFREAMASGAPDLLRAVARPRFYKWCEGAGSGDIEDPDPDEELFWGFRKLQQQSVSDAMLDELFLLGWYHLFNFTAHIQFHAPRPAILEMIRNTFALQHTSIGTLRRWARWRLAVRVMVGVFGAHDPLRQSTLPPPLWELVADYMVPAEDVSYLIERPLVLEDTMSREDQEIMYQFVCEPVNENAVSRTSFF